jgi:hypothetical protein
MSLCEELTASSSMPVARAIRSNNGSIKMASVSFIVSFPPLYVILAFPLCKNGLLLSFSGETTYPYTQYRYIMAGVLEQLIRPQKRPVVYCNPSAMELQTAKEILAEVFRVRLSEVDEMLQNRIEKAPSEAACCEKDGLWPQEFCLEG